MMVATVNQDSGCDIALGMRQQGGVSALPCTTLTDMIAAYERHGNVRDAARELAIGKNRLSETLSRGGYRMRRMRVTQATRDRILEYYKATPAEDFDLEVLSAELRRAKSSVSRIARRMGLSDRSRPMPAATRSKIGEASASRIAMNGHPRGMSGKTLSDEARAKVSQASRAMHERHRLAGAGCYSEENRQKRSDRMSKMRAQMPAENAYSRCKGGRRADIGPMYFRSAWEANYARYLNWLVAKGEIDGWEYEPTTFWFEAIKRGVRSYKPDFLIYQAGRQYYVEVKGYMDAKSRTKLRRMAKYYPDVDMRVLGSKDYEALRSRFSRLISGWE